MEVNVIKQNVVALDCHENCNMVIVYLVDSIIPDAEIRGRMIDYAKEKFENYTLVSLLQMNPLGFYEKLRYELASDIVNYLVNDEYKVCGFKVAAISCYSNELQLTLANKVSLTDLWNTFYNLNNGGEVIEGSEFQTEFEKYTEKLIDEGELVEEVNDEEDEPDDNGSTDETKVIAHFLIKTDYEYGYGELKKRFMNRINHELSPKNVSYICTLDDNGYNNVILTFTLDGLRDFDEVIEILTYRFGPTCPRAWYACKLQGVRTEITRIIVRD